MREYFNSEKKTKGPVLPMEKVNDWICATLKVNKNTVVKIYKEKRKILEDGSSKLQMSNKKRKISKCVTNFDAFEKDSIPRHIYDYFSRKDYLTKKFL